MTKKLLMNEIGGNSESIPYETLEYIEGTGSQYINTEVKPTLNTKIELELFFKKNNPTYAYLFGCDSFMKINFTAYVSTVNVYKYGQRLSDLKISETSDAKCTYIVDMADKSKYIRIIKDDSEISAPNFTSSMSQYSTQKQFHILNACTGSGDISTSYVSKGRIYGCKIWEKGELIRNFIPVLDNDGIPCLYDSINNKCHYNVGTSNFGYSQ